MFIRISLLILLAFQLTSAQDFSRNWKSHFSYNDIVAITSSEATIYAAASNSIFIHSIAQNTNRQFTTVDGLSAANISVIEYDEERELIIVGFSNGLIEIINENTNAITSLNDIVRQINFPPDQIKINDFFIDNSILYVATGFGIVEYDLENSVFKNTYLLSDSVNTVSDITGVGVIGDFIIASIAGRGTFTGDKNDPNLIEFSNWDFIQPEEFEQFELFSGQLIARDSKNIFAFTGTILEPQVTVTSNIIDFSTNNNKLSISLSDKYLSLNSNFETISNVDFEASLANKLSNFISINDELFFSQNEMGLQKTNNLDINNRTSIIPNGPLNNSPFSIEAFQGDLWVVYGTLSGTFNDNTPSVDNGISRLRNGEWVNIPFSEYNSRRLVDIVINPENKGEVYFSSFTDGILKYDEASDSFENFNTENSNIELRPNRSFPSIFALEFSEDGNLWFTNHDNEKLVKRLSTSGSNENDIDLTGIMRDFRSPDIAFSNRGNLFLATRTGGLVGVNTSTQNIISLSDLEENNVPFVTVRTLAFDNNGELWFGTNRGLRVISSPDRLFEPGARLEAESIIFLDDGIPQELLADQFITKIIVDSENNKWVATSGSGVFQFSPDGQETLNHFTTANSPLPSNEIISLSIDVSTGAVFMGSANGIVELKSNIVEAEENLNQLKVFPNPVRPQYGEVTVRIEGLTAGANVKITDIEGNLVFEDQNPNINGTGSGLIEWNTRSFSGKKVASGVYLILINSEDQTETSVEKLLIIR